MRRRASSTTISVWTQTSPSGCHSGSCGHPTSARNSGHSRSTTPMSSASRKPIDGTERLEQQLFDFAPDPFGGQIIKRDPSAELHVFSRRRRARTVRRTAVPAARGGCHRQTSSGSTTRRRRASRSVRPPTGSSISSVRGSHRIALTVKSRRRADSVHRHRRIALDDESLVPAAALRFAPWQRHVNRAQLVDREALTHGIDPAETAEERGRSSWGIPNTSRSRSFDVRPSRRSRTKPPTTSARPPRCATSPATARASSRGDGWI